MGVHLLVLPFKMGIYRKRNVHGIGSSLPCLWGITATFCSDIPLHSLFLGYHSHILF